MNNLKLSLSVMLCCALVSGSVAWAAPAATSPYVTDVQNAYVQDATSDTINSVNMVLCIMDSMNISGSGMLNKGPYIALINKNRCDAHGSASDSSGGASGASAAANYMTAVVDATRAGSSDPMIGHVWMSLTENGSTNSIFVRVSASQSPTEVPPYGVFRMDYLGKDSSNSTKFNGFISATSGSLQYYETGTDSSNVAMSMTATSTTAGSGTLAPAVGGGTTYNFNYNSGFFRRSDGTHDQCFDRTKANADRSVWSMGTYNANDGSRVDQANPSFQITAAYLGNSYYGNAGYWGLNFQGLNLNTITDASPVSGLVVTDQRPGNSSTYSLSKLGGKLTKWTRNTTTLAAMDGIPFVFYADLTNKTVGNVAVGFANWQMQWNNTAANFTVTGKQDCSGSNGCKLTTLGTPATVNAGAFNGVGISGWSDSFGGNINIPPTGSPHAGANTFSYFSQSTVIPGSASEPTSLRCLSNCPDHLSVASANSFTSGSAPSPFGGTTVSQWFTAPLLTNTVSYNFGAGGLTESSTAMIINNTAFFTNNSMFQNGVMSGRLFDTSVTGSKIHFCNNTAAPYCEPADPAAYYTWSTGPQQWNQSLWLTKTSDSTVVTFDPPQNIPYTVPSGAAYGSWANKSILLQFNGFGNLYGIPGYCVNPVDNSPVDCSSANARYVPMFSIPDGATMTLGSTPLIVKALQEEIRLKDLGASAAQCAGMSLTPLTPPAGGVHDMSSSSDAYYIGIKPVVTSNPKVIDGIVQY